MRNFVTTHAEYTQDSALSVSISYDLIRKCSDRASVLSMQSSTTHRQRVTYLRPLPKTTFIWPQWLPNRWPRPQSCLALEITVVVFVFGFINRLFCQISRGEPYD